MAKRPDSTTEGKIADDELRALAAADAPDAVEVIVEADLPSSKLSPVADDGCPSPRRFRIDETVGSDERDRLLDQLELFLRDFDDQVVRLRSARAFVVRTDGRRLRRIAASPLVKRIRANRRLGNQ